MSAKYVRTLLITSLGLCALLFVVVRLVTAHPPPTPAIIVQSTDAHRLLSSSVDARVGRLLQDHLPPPTATGEKLVALTFDDGPYPIQTPLLLDTLADLHVKATFFLIGNDAREFPGLTMRIAREGHEIADHTLTHPAHFEALSAEQVREELDGGAAVLERYAHDPAIRTMMRPPHGRFTEQTARAVQRAGYHMILWNEDPGDWRTVSPEALARDVELHATAPDIILLHSGRVQTTEMLPEVIARFRKAGYAFVTVGELMKRVPPRAIIHPIRHSV